MTDIPAARHALRLLKFVASQSGPVRASTVVRELGIPRSTTYQLIKVMQEEGFLVHFPEDRAYGLSPLMSEIGSNYLRTSKVSRLAEPLLEKLVKRTGLPVVAHLGVLHNDDIEYVVKHAAPRAPSLVTDIGVHLPAHLTATGRAILALLPKEQVRALYPHPASLTTRNGRGPATLRELDEILAETRSRGYALETGEITPDLASVAVAALDHNGYPAAAIGITFRKIAVDLGTWPQLGAAAQISAGALSMRLRGKI
ncbi:IclR family transcriptional regulator [uncultured Microbacterium sp.]|uniref:Transcriptional regulator, IclR family protein n=1 Tax=uncultured Microbacterium sp. TaxID=191216 RepID=A0A1Y5P355_9MICO|nr:IclR family transcriptional regulator [uncultured Microbacterium sp.]SBS71749.1 Transcriptional regulator, IclR family protein [uncultured Microbacterium sp.]